MGRIELHRQTAQQVAVLAKHLHREVALAQEVGVRLIEILLLEVPLLVRCRTLRLKALQVGVLLILTEVTERLTHLASELKTGETLLRTKLTRLLAHALRFKSSLLVSERGLKARLSPQLLRLQQGVEVLLADSETCLLVSERGAQCLIGVEPLSLQLRCEVLHVRLRSRVEVSESRLHPRLGAKLLLLQRCL